MKKSFRFYLISWIVLLILFNVIAFVVPGASGQETHTTSFWIGYGCITLAMIGQLACAYYALKESNKQKLFYNISLVTTSYTGLILSVVFGGLCMLIAILPYWVGVILCTIVLALNAIAVLKAAAAVSLVSGVDEKIKAQTLFIKSLTVDAESLLACAATPEAKAACKKVYEAVRYSDPMSNDVLVGVESQITLKFNVLSDAVMSSADTVSTLADELIILIDERNKRCKLLKKGGPL